MVSKKEIDRVLRDVKATGKAREIAGVVIEPRMSGPRHIGVVAQFGPNFTGSWTNHREAVRGIAGAINDREADRALAVALDGMAALPGRPSPQDVAHLKDRIRNVIESLLAFLDALDGDPDLEDGGDDEPSLGSIGSDWSPYSQTAWSAGTCQDLEEDAADQPEIDEDFERDPAEEGEPDEQFEYSSQPARLDIEIGGYRHG